jgi:hypothetical protein
MARVRRALLSRLEKVRADFEGGAVVPVLLRLAGGRRVAVSRVVSVEDRIACVWFHVVDARGDLITLRFDPGARTWEIHSVETDDPGRWEATSALPGAS